MHLIHNLLVLIACDSLAVAFLSRSPKQGFDWDSTQYLIAFGDSYTYIQGTEGHPNYSFIGDQLDFGYNAQTLLNDKIVQNRLWDFAFAGADISVDHTPLHHNFTVSLVNQVAQYRTYGHPVLKHIVQPSSTLVAIWIGINDINDSAKYTVHFPSFYNELMDTLFASVLTLYSLGYRSYLFMNLPPLDRTPSNQKRASPSPNATQVAWFNEALAQHAGRFAHRYSDTNVLLFNAHSVLNDMMDHPAQSEILNTTSFCSGYDQPDIEWNHQSYGCPTPVHTYFWFNSGHLTSHVHKLLAKAVEETLKQWTG
ncbi:hypothetical protein BDV28DRAFT_160958 [Aspergillus coremiiformis]|uniref:Uncharacterized protein n=1 Tax=Aspergillus coremiiformis TaxID=138285 RepID=A0A5N6YTR0_9EURO|nr:hypothetical protein BDV28DRAFT_160958 [Aspergillus coremiiformis]